MRLACNLQRLTKNLSFFFGISLDLRAKEEAAVRQQEEAARDQADAGTPSREEAGKFPSRTLNCSQIFLYDENVLFPQLNKNLQNFHFSYTLRTKN